MNPISELLAEDRYETARRVGVRLLAKEPTFDSVIALHEAYAKLGDFPAARDLLERWLPCFPESREYMIRCLAKIYRTMAHEQHYRLSREGRQGYSVDEYIVKYRELSVRVLEEAGLDPEPQDGGRPCALVPSLCRDRIGRTVVTGRICDEAGQPFGGVRITLGLESEKVEWHERNTMGNGYQPELPEMEAVETVADAAGFFRFEGVPAGVHDYLAVRLDPRHHLVATRFIAREIAVQEDGYTDLGELRVVPWRSAPAASLPKPEGGAEQLAAWVIANPFEYDFHRQPVTFPLPEGVDASSPMHVVTSEGPEHFQIMDREIFLLSSLRARSRLEVRLLHGEADLDRSPLWWRDEGEYWLIHTGCADFRIAGNTGPRQPPVLAIRGADGVWRGEGHLRLPKGITVIGGRTELLESGPVRLRFLVKTCLSNGNTYRLELTALAGQPLLLVRETASALEGGAFEFSLREFSGGRGYLHWLRECGGFHWSTLGKQDAVKATLPEHVPWWIPPHGFGYAVTMDGLGSKDYIGLFSVRRGEWIDRAFARLANGPINRDGSGNPELDWIYPEMVGSSISAITVQTDARGDVFFRFGMFDGERQWALLASSFPENDGRYKAISALQHAYTAPRLIDFRKWKLDAPDCIERPFVMLQRSQLPSLREKTRRFPTLWRLISEGPVEGPAEGVCFAIEGDPVLAWRKRCTLLAVATVRARAMLLGRDWSDMYTPVAGRVIAHWMHEYDLIAASGVFSEEEERHVRSFFILTGHLFMEKDFMNWGFNARNANFEADRAEIVGTIGLAFSGHPDAEEFMDHAEERLRSMLRVYCNPESGKWYENPACYYRVACRSWSNLAVHLARHGRLKLAEVPLLREFLRWGITLLTPALPDYNVMHSGDAETFEAAERVRKVPPIGDHAGLGRWLMGHYYSIAKEFAREDPDFGRELLAAFCAANPFGSRTLNQRWDHPKSTSVFDHPFQPRIEAGVLSFFIDLEEEDEKDLPLLELRSQRLSGFGAILRNRVHTPQEDYLLIKQGPGGYRYHRTEGSFIYFAEGRPLIFDGGEAGETWRHSTLSFHDVHTPISPGRVERYFADSEFHFVQGVHPEVIKPGEPIFLSDSCCHELLEECYRRFEKQDPALVRAFAWVGSEYLIVSDVLATEAPSHWHLQVVADQCQEHGEGEYRFIGRHGVDLQVLFPDQSLRREVLESLPVYEYTGSPEQWFSMMHLQVADPQERGYLALLRPLSARQPHTLEAERLCSGAKTVGIAVRGNGIDDRIWLHRGEPTKAPGFHGTFGALLRRPDRRIVWLGGEGWIELEDGKIEAGPGITNLFWSEALGEVALRAEGVGEIVLRMRGKTQRFAVEREFQREMSRETAC